MIKEFFMSPQVWAGTDACEPVTWQECKLVPKDVKFIVPEIKCEPKQELWYHEPEEVMDNFDDIVCCFDHIATSHNWFQWPLMKANIPEFRQCDTFLTQMLRPYLSFLSF